MIEGKEACPKCGKNQMPRWNPQGMETARACQSCGEIEERADKLEGVGEGKP